MKNGRKWKNIGLTPREAVGLFLVFTVGQYLDSENTWTIGSDPEEGDGGVICAKGEKEGDYFAVEQVYICSIEDGEISDLVEKMVELKSSRGNEYAKGRHLVVYCDKSGSLDLSQIKKYFNNQELFMSYWIIARVDAPLWNYLVVTPKTSSDPTFVYKVKLENDFSDWSVSVLGDLENLKI
ncbi:MAG: hypothetical protein Q7T59_05625 [Candidatus Woesebacteria bacterium]|nr:hypothetical protein [Candidatus Woesebacteria bacterium]